MKKFVFLFAILIYTIVCSAQTPFYTYYFDNNAKSESDTFNLNLKADFIHSDYLNFDSVTIELFKLKSIHNFGYNQTVFSQTLTPYNCTVKVLGETVDAFGNTIQKLSIKDITNQAFGFDASYSIADKSSYVGFSDCPFNANIVKSFPDSIKQYLNASTEIQSTDVSIIALAQQITSGCTTTAQMVEKIVKWLGTNVSYDFTFNHAIQDAISVTQNKTALCEGYSNLMCALLRSVGIASRRVDGFMTSNPISLTVAGNKTTVKSTQGSHSWVEVFYPTLNAWVSTEPQSNANLIYANYIVFNNGVQALIKEMSISSSSSILPGSNSVSIGTVTSDTIYVTNLVSTKGEAHTTTGGFKVLMALDVAVGSKTPTPILKDTSGIMCDNVILTPQFIVTNPSGTITWIQDGVKTVGDTLIPTKPATAISSKISVVQSTGGCGESDTAKAVLKVFKKSAAPEILSSSLTGCCYVPILFLRNSNKSDSVQWVLDDNIYLSSNYNTYSHQLMPKSIGSYKAIVIDSLGCFSQTSNVVTITELSVPEISKQPIILYPNPTKGIVSFSSEMLNNATVELYNWVGLLLETKKVSGEKLSIDLSKYPAGIYSVIVRNEQGQWSGAVVKE